LNTGEWFNPSFQNSTVFTLGLPKEKIMNSNKINKLFVADIGIPREVYKKIGLDVPMMFLDSDYEEIQS
jgi:hypothetical protein